MPCPCTQQVFRITNHFPPIVSLEQQDVLLCGVRNLNLDPGANIHSCFCMRNLSARVAQKRTILFTARHNLLSLRRVGLLLDGSTALCTQTAKGIIPPPCLLPRLYMRWNFSAALVSRAATCSISSLIHVVQKKRYPCIYLTFENFHRTCLFLPDPN